MSRTNVRRDRNFARLDESATNSVAEELLAQLPRDPARRTLPHTLPGCSLTATGEFIPEEARTPQTFENGQYIAVCNVVARELQKYNTRNRQLMKSNTEKLLTAMRCREWMYNGKSSVLVCSNTAILDSQHTLAAMVRYFEATETDYVKTPFLMRVELGLHPDVFSTIDHGAKRLLKDTFHVESSAGNVDYDGVPDTVIASATRLLLQYLNDIYELKEDDINYLPNQRAGLINSRALKIINMYPGLITSAQFVCSLRNMRQVVREFIPVVAHMLISEAQSPTAANNFVRALATGSDLPEGSPIIALRSLYIKGVQNSRRMEGPEALAYFIHAWNKFAEGKSVDPGRLKSFGPEGKIPTPRPFSRQRAVVSE